MGFFSDLFGGDEKKRGFAEREAALRDTRDAARRVAKVLRTFQYDPGDAALTVKQHYTTINENGKLVYRVDPDLTGYGIFDLTNGDRCVGSIDGDHIRLPDGVEFSYGSTIPEFGWSLVSEDSSLYIYDRNERLVAEVGMKRGSNHIDRYIHICRAGIELRIIALAVVFESKQQYVVVPSEDAQIRNYAWNQLTHRHRSLFKWKRR